MSARLSLTGGLIPCTRLLLGAPSALSRLDVKENIEALEQRCDATPSASPSDGPMPSAAWMHGRHSWAHAATGTVAHGLLAFQGNSLGPMTVGNPHVGSPTQSSRAFATRQTSIQRKLRQQLDGMKLALPDSPFAPGRLGPAVPRQILYRGPGLLLFRFLVRAKVFQLAGVFAGCGLLMAVFSAKDANPWDIAAILSVMVGSIITSYCIWFYSGRYVGELSLLLPERRVARFSVLDFWGSRKDNDIPLERLQPPFRGRSVAEVRALAGHVLMPLTISGDRQYFISVRHGKLYEKDILQKICYGTWLEELDAQKMARNHGMGAASTAGPTVTSGATQPTDASGQRPQPAHHLQEQASSTQARDASQS